MRAGMLDRQIQIVQPTETRGSYGEVIPGWSVVATLWANYKPTGGGESQVMDETSAALYATWKIRYMTGITSKMRIVDGYGMSWNIKSIIEGGRREWLEIAAEAPSVQ